MSRHHAHDDSRGTHQDAHVYFGGPDRPPRLLRDILEERIESVPPGGEIDWVAYYFRDRALARSLVRAHRRGVRVRVAVDGRPRLAGANDQVGLLLGGREGIGAGFRAVRPARLAGFGPRSRLHAKIYCFDHPRPAALVGSFNPSGDDPDDPRIISRIGDQDRGHNALVELTDPALVSALRAHARRLHAGAGRPLWRWRVPANRVVHGGDTALCFYPRIDHRLVLNHLDRLEGGDRLRIATSHVKAKSVLRSLYESRDRGAEISIVTHDTERRAPQQVVRELQSGGLDVRRYCHRLGLPMHNKFMLLESAGRRRVYFGSLNLNRQSQLLNHELLVWSDNPALFDAFAARWEDIYAETGTG